MTDRPLRCRPGAVPRRGSPPRPLRPPRRAGCRSARAARQQRQTRLARRHQTSMSSQFLIALTIFATAGSPRNTLNGTIGTPGATPRARSARPSRQTTMSASSGVESTGVCSTVTLFFLSWPRSVLASMTLLPMPASHATTSLETLEPLMVVISSTYFPGGFGGGHLFLGFGQVDVGDDLVLVGFSPEPEERAGDDERDDRGQDDSEDHPEEVALGGDAHERDEASRRRRTGEADVEELECRDSRGSAADRGEDHLGAHEH